MVQDGDRAWNPDSDQLHIDFAAGDQSQSVAGRIVRSAQQTLSPLSASGWFHLGADLESSAPDQALSAYTNALALDPDHTDAHVNLGRLLQLGGRIQEAIGHYRRALSAGTDDPTAAFNLGTALEEAGQWTAAIEAYRRALRMDRAFADAHFNLARLCEQLGRDEAAIRHLREYQILNGSGVGSQEPGVGSRESGVGRQTKFRVSTLRLKAALARLI
jgi:tetratricopeptide (TPR) repeat protein